MPCTPESFKSPYAQSFARAGREWRWSLTEAAGRRQIRRVDLREAFRKSALMICLSAGCPRPLSRSHAHHLQVSCRELPACQGIITRDAQRIPLDSAEVGLWGSGVPIEELRRKVVREFLDWV